MDGPVRTTKTAQSLLGRLAPIVLGVAVGLLVLAPFAAAAQRSAQLRACGGESNTVLAEFDLAHARDIWQRLPAMLRAPELEQDERPAHVIVFGGSFETTDLGATGYGGPKPQTLSDVVCVIQADGTLNIYYGVSREGTPWGP